MPDADAEQIYQEPDIYDLEHSKDEPDVGFFLSLARQTRSRRILELACGNGRIALPLARMVKQWDGIVVGLDSSEAMLEAARQKAGAESLKDNLSWICGDMRSWRTREPFDLILCPCSSMSHLLPLDNQIAAWTSAHANLTAEGRFVVAEQMASLPALAESQHNPPRAVLEIDNDTERTGSSGFERLVRYRATRYFAHEQRASIHFLYDKLANDSAVSERFLSDYQCHVFYPRELELLYRLCGFEVEKVWGDYHGGPFGERSRHMILSGRKRNRQGVPPG